MAEKKNVKKTKSEVGNKKTTKKESVNKAKKSPDKTKTAKNGSKTKVSQVKNNKTVKPKTTKTTKNKKKEVKKVAQKDNIKSTKEVEEVKDITKTGGMEVELPKNDPVKNEAKKNAPVNNVVKAKSFNGNMLALVFASVAIVLSGASAVFSYLSYEKANTPITILTPDSGDGNTASFVEGSVADVVDKVSESVVSIVTSVTATSFFGQSYSASAAGTGIIVSEDGYILTNKHVVDGATKISVVLDDGTTYDDVKLAAYDPLNDVAFLKIKDVSDLKVATLGDSKTITVGQQVIAIGNALGQYQNSVTSGIISGIGRSLTATNSTGSMSEKLTDMIQTDAAINSGNSGGPLVNAAGQVIGINTATSSSGDNVGFAIPISSVKGMLAQLKEKGEASRAYVGVYSSEITPEVAKSYNLPVSEGVYLYSSSAYSAIISGSSAEKAGLKNKDIITAVNGVKLGAAGSLSSLIGEYKPGDTVQLTVIRDGKEIAVNVTLGAYSEK